MVYYSYMASPMESGQVSSDAALARGGLLDAALPTAGHINLRQSTSTIGEVTQRSLGNDPSAGAPIRTVSKASSTNFSAVNVEAAAALNCLSSYNEIVGKLNRLWDDQIIQIHNVTDCHWKNPEFPLARIKKIMRMDEEVKMISSEVPLMLSKAVEIFVTELSLRAWLHTEESKRRTVQRSDIAMAITKQDMFDFLIDIVPREEVQLKSKPQTKQQGDGDQVQLLTPELLQLYLQHISQQQTTATTQEQQTTAQEQQQQQQTPPAQQQHQQIISQLQQQQQQKIGVGLEGDVDEASARIFQDNLALIQQLQQLLHLQLQMQQLQGGTTVTSDGSNTDHTQSLTQSLHLPTTVDELTQALASQTSQASIASIASSVLNQPDQILASSATDNIHRVIISAANDMLTESDLQSAITSLTSGDRDTDSHSLHSLRSSSSSGHHVNLLTPTTHLHPSTSLSSYTQSNKGTLVSMTIEPELVEQGTLASSPSSSSHGLPDDTDITTTTLLVDPQQNIQNSTSLSLTNPTPLCLTSSDETLDRNSSSSSLLTITGQMPSSSLITSGSHEEPQSTTSLLGGSQLRQFQQLDQLDSQLSNILVQTAADSNMGMRPEQYVIQTTPLVDLVSNTHTNINPSSTVLSAADSSIDLTGSGFKTSSCLSTTLTPINATLEPMETDRQ